MKRWLLVPVVLAALLLLTPSSRGGLFNRGCKDGRGGNGCAAPSRAVSYTYQTRTVMAPQWVTELRTVTVTDYKSETRTRKVTRCRMVPVTEQVPVTIHYMEREVRKVPQTYIECVRVTKPRERTFTVMVPVVEKRTATRRVAKPVQVVEKRAVCRDLGHYEVRCFPQTVSCDNGRGRKRRGLLARLCGRDRGCDDGCDSGCAPHTVLVTRRVWVPKPVTVMENVTVCKIEWIEQPYEYTVTTHKPEVRKETVNVTRFERVPKTREVTRTFCVPKTRTETRSVTRYKPETFEAQETYTVCVPVPVQKQVPVRVCKMVPKTVRVCVPVYAPAPCPPAPCPPMPHCK